MVLSALPAGSAPHRVNDLPSWSACCWDTPANALPTASASPVPKISFCKSRIFCLRLELGRQRERNPSLVVIEKRSISAGVERWSARTERRHASACVSVVAVILQRHVVFLLNQRVQTYRVNQFALKCAVQAWGVAENSIFSEYRHVEVNAWNDL